MSDQQGQVVKRFLSKPKLTGLAIILLAVVIFMFLKMTRPQQPAIEIKQKIWPIMTMQIKLSNHAPVYTLYGTVESNSLVTAAAPVAGVIEALPVKEGDEIVEGQLLVSLAAADIELPYDIAKADVADTSAQLNLQDLNYQANEQRLRQEQEVLKLKQQEVKRNRELLRKKLQSQSSLDQSIEALTRQEFSVVGAELSVQENRAKVEQFKARLAKAEANLKQAEINRIRGVVYAPYDGRVADVHVAQGDRVGINSAMVSYYAIESLELRAKIPVGQTAMVYQAMQSGEALAGQFMYNDLAYDLPLQRLDGQATASGVDAFFDIPESLKMLRPGDLLTVQLPGSRVEGSFAVPYSAVYGSDRIYQVEDDQLKAVTVQLLGDTLLNGESWALVKGDIADNAMIATTHLPNAITGLKVSVMELQ